MLLSAPALLARLAAFFPVSQQDNKKQLTFLRPYPERPYHNKQTNRNSKPYEKSSRRPRNSWWNFWGCHSKPSTTMNKAGERFLITSSNDFIFSSPSNKTASKTPLPAGKSKIARQKNNAPPGNFNQDISAGFLVILFVTKTVTLPTKIK